MKNVKAMNINELDFVAGGSAAETAKDSFELWDRMLMDDHYGSAGIMIKWNEKSRNVDKAWAKAGVEVITKPFGSNVYRINGQEVDRDQALEHLKTNFTQLRKVS